MWGKEGRSMTDEAKAKMMQGVFQGADLSHAQINMVVESGATVNYYGQQPVQLSDDQQACADELAPVFFGDKQEAELFVSRIVGMNDKQIIDFIVLKVREKKISPISFRKPLYDALHSHQLYRAGKTNFDTMLRNQGIND